MKKMLKGIKRILLVTVFILMLGALAVTGHYTYLGYEMFSTALEKKSVSEMAADIKSRCRFAEYKELPAFYVNAVIASEDRNFFGHNGIDVFAICRAVLHDIKVKAPEQGGSTITQQLAKNEYFTQEKRLERKLAEFFMAIKIENELSKEEIFALYSNSIYFGSGYYGLESAAKGYFGKDITELSEYECAMLAGIPNAPTAYSPDSSPELARERTEKVIENMVSAEYITEEQADRITGKIT
ncbi:MAG: biosynthetic peptidoglycan transglycosylase [Oscillospiraceae bacterium]|nr:transglycosylase domain-containing protein [Oscillospiraceae bacterium]MDD7278381.1 transglycosylase domain-containing protein [Oscillospiraceae bacterium]MDY2863309.1 biosynthetic peptidoglycan transglycosylase [Oscillospiraceae bacterium]